MQTPIDRFLQRPGRMQGGRYGAVETPVSKYIASPSPGRHWLGGAPRSGFGAAMGAEAGGSVMHGIPTGRPFSFRGSSINSGGGAAHYIPNFMGSAGAGRFGRVGWGAKAQGYANTAEGFLGRSFSVGGRSMSYGRAGLAGGMGLLAVSQAGSFVNRMRTGDYAGAALSGGLAVAAGGAAYSAAMGKFALRDHFRKAAAFVVRNLR